MIWRDLRFGLRQFSSAPGFCAAVAVTLALGIGVNTAVFSLLDGFLLRKLPYPEPDRVAALVIHQQGVSAKTGKPFEDNDDSFDGGIWNLLKENVRAVRFASYGGTNGLNMRADGAVQYLLGTRVSADYFSVLGIPLQAGRGFTEEEDLPKGPAAVVISSRLWRSAFRSDDKMVGKAISLKGEPYTVVGILAANAVTPSNADVFTPLRPAPTGECGGNNCGIFVRLQPGATWQQAQTQLDHVPLPERLMRQYRFPISIRPQPLRQELAGEKQDQVVVLMAAVGLILLIACANLASLSLVRISQRAQEIATRLAVGASRWTLLRQLWIETLVLALSGAALGVLLAFAIVNSLGKFLLPEMLPVGGFTVDAHALAFTFAVSVLTSILFGALPATQAWRLDLRSSIVSGSRAILGGSSRLRQWLIGMEVALTVVLLAAAGLMVRTLVHLETRPPGFDPHNVMTAKASLDDARYHDAGQFQMLLTKSVAAMKEELATEDVAVGLSLPYERGLNDGVTILDGRNAGERNGSSMAYVTAGYFSTLRIHLLSGRLFNDSDTAASQPVAVVNDAFAKKLLKEGSPLGRHIKVEGTTYTVVGLVADVAKRPGLEQRGPLGIERVFYVPAAQIPQGLANMAHVWFQPSWIVRTAREDRAAAIRGMQLGLAKVAPDLPFSGFYSMDQILAEQLWQQRIEVTLLTSLAGLALLLSAVGIYALVSNLVVQRRREIGIRLVLGSSLRRAMVDVGSPGAIATLAGLAVGIVLSFAALRVLRSQLFGVQVYDPLTLMSVIFALAVIGGGAICLPALRIGRMTPADSLRSE